MTYTNKQASWIFIDSFIQDNDGKWNLKEIQDFAIATNGGPVSVDYYP